VPQPVSGPGEVLVGVEAAAVNYPDVLLVQNRYQMSVPVPFTPGSEFAGRVCGLGDGVDGFEIGDLVMGAVITGAFAEFVCVDAAALTRVPDGLDAEAAAAGTVAMRTAYHSLVTIGGLEAGDQVVILGAAGGVGSACVQIATRLGAVVIAAVSTEQRAQWCRELGADHTIVYTTDSLKDRIKQITGAGADLVIDPVGGKHSEQALRATAWGGRLVVVGFADGEIPRIPLNLVLLKGVIVRGIEIRTLADHMPDEVAEGDRRLLGLYADGLRPAVTDVVPLERATEVLERIRARNVTGKVVIRP
jgi:NADPH2:quinone reductase